MPSKEIITNILKKYNFWDHKPIDFGYLRATYLQQFNNFLGSNLVKVVLGQRRSGKSRLMRMMINCLIADHAIPVHNILYINKELYDFNFITDDHALMKVIEIYREICDPKGKVYFFIDEVQEIKYWEKIINSLSQDYTLQAEVFITGSNANLLSSELATYLSGRYVSIMVYPFSYAEYLNIFALERNKSSALQYLHTGGLPELYQLNTTESKEHYIQSLLDSIVLRDIVQRNHIRDVDLLERVINFIIDSIGSMVSISSILKTLKHHGYKSNAETIGNYLKFCQDAFFIHECPRYDLRGKQILVGEKKYYLNDLAFKNKSQFEIKITRMLENAVYLSLLRQGYNVYVGRYNNQEIDFIAENAQEKLYIQVCYILADDDVIEREFRPLLALQDNYPKWVVTMDEINIGNIEGVLHKQVWDILV